MYTKKCPACNKNSFSSSDKGQWICPYCEKDITSQLITIWNNGKNNNKVGNKIKAVDICKKL